ncbi:MerR family transcriptional regulator [Corynebacterium atrinae]|uniref:MerR family transcriptional regulator n=1 Tax=Corynebacterium atrinae TaxID=1336740 RepID=UPI0025B5097C|nr:MerR family transcriptional regulator [Corynebacterium atrinae]
MLATGVVVAETTGRKIGEVAAQTGLSIRTLRHYDDLGIITPSGHTPGGFRLYSLADVERLLLIDRMKPLGFTLDQIREFLQAVDTLPASTTAGQAEEAREILASFQEQMRLRLDKLRRQVASSEAFLTQLDTLNATCSPHTQR